MAKKRMRTKKHPMVFVRHSMVRIFRNLLFAALICVLLWWMAPYTPGYFRPPNDIFLIMAIVLLLVGMILSVLFRGRGFAQAKMKHLLIKVPLMRTRVRYEDIENVRMTLLKEIYEKEKMSWAQRRFLEPYLPKTVVVVNLKRFRTSEFLLRMILPSYLFLPGSKGRGFVIFTPQYLELSTDIDSYLSISKSVEMGAMPVARRPKPESVSADGFFDLDG